MPLAPHLRDEQIPGREPQPHHLLKQMGAFEEEKTCLPTPLRAVKGPETLHQWIAPAGDQLGTV